MPPEPLFRLRRCTVRAYDAEDSTCLAKAANNLKIAQWMRNTFPQPYTVTDATSWISRANSSTPAYDFAICSTDGSTVIGGIGLKPRDDIHYRTMEIGYWLSEDYWHQGIATEAVAAFSGWAFDTFNHLLRLEAEVYDGNGASGRVLDKAGFELEARQKMAIEKDGVVMDALMYCKFREGA